MSLQAYLKRDSWLSGMLEMDAFQADVAAFKDSAHDLSQAGLPQSCFLQVKVNADDIQTLMHLQQSGFYVIDTNVVYKLQQKDLPTTEVAPAYSIRYATSEDEKGVMACAYESFVYTRFHLDPNIAEKIANQLKSEWAGNFFKGLRGHEMIVALDANHQIAGFCQNLNPQEGTRVIDLIAVSEQHRRRGLAQSMISFESKQLDEIIVGTQVSNIPSIRCYEALGFRMIKSQYVLHYYKN